MKTLDFKLVLGRCLVSLMLAAALLGGLWLTGGALHPAQAASFNYGFAPQKYKEGDTYGNGVFFAPYRFTLYTKPDEHSPKIGEFRWSHDSQSNTLDVVDDKGEHHIASANRVFFCFYPQLDVAMMAVIGDDESGWVEVVYDQGSQKSGCVRLKDAPEAANTKNSEAVAATGTSEPEHFGIYQTWLEFMKLNSKASGVYWLSGVTQYNRSIRSADADDAKMVSVTIIRDIKVKHVRGNWLLVEVLDFERNTPLGWVRWRDDDGNLMVFPNLTQQRRPIVTTAY